MSYQDVLIRIAEIQSRLVPTAAVGTPPAAAPATAAGAGDASTASFQQMLQAASDGAAPMGGSSLAAGAAALGGPGLGAGAAALGGPGLGAGAAALGGPGLGAGAASATGAPLPLAGGGGGAALLAAAQREVGVAEQPPGSNDSPRIAQYRQATAGSGVGPWCAYFTSWAARQAGTPLGDQGQGFGSVDALYAWAQRAGRAVPNGPGVVPRPGDLIVWDEHIGVVESVQPDGSVATIEGNSSDRVSRRVHPAGSALGYVRMS